MPNKDLQGCNIPEKAAQACLVYKINLRMPAAFHNLQFKKHLRISLIVIIVTELMVEVKMKHHLPCPAGDSVNGVPGMQNQIRPYACSGNTARRLCACSRNVARGKHASFQ